MYYKKDYIHREIINIFSQHNIDIPTDFIQDVFDNYENIPFHNIVHAFEVFIMTNNLVNIVQSKQMIFKKYEVAILLITALCHDINHKGKTNTYLKKCNSHNNVFTIDEHETLNREELYLSISSYSYDSLNHIGSLDSLNENTHIQYTLNLLEKYEKQIFPKKCSWNEIQQLITSLILSTDLFLHDNYISEFNIRNKYSLANIIIKLADISHPMQSFGIHCYWTLKIKEEQNTFHNFDSLKEIAQDTLFFINKFLYPLIVLFDQYFDILQYKNALEKNINIWKSYSN